MTTKRAPKDQKPEDKLTTDRLDPEMLADIELNPTEFLRKRYQTMLAKEQQIIDNLYTQDPIDDKALTAALKRITDIGDSLKALPKQSTETAANQKSLAEIIQDAIDRHLRNPQSSSTAFRLGEVMLTRSETAFGEGS
jgi:predicted transcriptional regulator